MKLKLVSLETAVALKEVGFEYHSWNNWRQVVAFSKGSRASHVLPTLSLVQMWLREEHSIIVTVELDRTSLPKYQYNVCKFTKDDGFKNEINPDLHRTYDEALEVGILKGVKLIKEK